MDLGAAFTFTCSWWGVWNMEVRTMSSFLLLTCRVERGECWLQARVRHQTAADIAEDTRGICLLFFFFEILGVASGDEPGCCIGGAFEKIREASWGIGMCTMHTTTLRFFEVWQVQTCKPASRIVEGSPSRSFVFLCLLWLQCEASKQVAAGQPWKAPMPKLWGWSDEAQSIGQTSSLGHENHWEPLERMRSLGEGMFSFWNYTVQVRICEDFYLDESLKGIVKRWQWHVILNVWRHWSISHLPFNILYTGHTSKQILRFSLRWTSGVWWGRQHVDPELFRRDPRENATFSWNQTDPGGVHFPFSWKGMKDSCAIEMRFVLKA